MSDETIAEKVMPKLMSLITVTCYECTGKASPLPSCDNNACIINTLYKVVEEEGT